MNRKGQALIEFVLILPIFLLILFAIFDFGNIFYSKYELQNQSADIVKLIQDDVNIQEVAGMYSKLDIKVSSHKEIYKKIILKKELTLVTPMINRILGDPYIIEVERIVPND